MWNLCLARPDVEPIASGLVVRAEPIASGVLGGAEPIASGFVVWAEPIASPLAGPALPVPQAPDGGGPRSRRPRGLLVVGVSGVAGVAPVGDE